MSGSIPKVSVVIPFYRKLELFRKASVRNWLFQARGVEVVVVLDEPSQLSEVATHFAAAGLRGQILVNTSDHAWRPPCVALNNGIMRARGHSICILSPESILSVTPVVMWDWLEALWLDSDFVVGRFCDVGPDSWKSFDEGKIITPQMSWSPYGFLLANRNAFLSIGGYDERRQRWGGDDDDVYARLEASGRRRFNDPRFLVYHMNDCARQDRPPVPSEKFDTPWRGPMSCNFSVAHDNY